MVRMSEWAVDDDRLFFGEQAHHRVDFGGFERLGEAQVGQNGGHPPGEHGFAAAGRADHQQIVTAGRGHLEGALGVLLPAYLGEIVGALAVVGEKIGDRHRAGGEGALAVEKGDHLAEIAHAVDRHPLDDAPFLDVFGGQDQALGRPAAGGHRHRQHPAHRLDASVEGELAHHHEAPRRLGPDQAGGAEQADGHGQVEGGAVFFNVGGSQIDGDAARGEFVARVLDRRLDPILALLDRPLGQANGGELGQALGDVDLDLDRVGLDSEERPREHLRQHIPLLCTMQKTNKSPIY